MRYFLDQNYFISSNIHDKISQCVPNFNESDAANNHLSSYQLFLINKIFYVFEYVLSENHISN